MSEQTRNPTSDEAVSGTWTGTAGSRYQVVDDYPDSTGTDELTHGTTAGNLTFGFSAFSIPDGATAISVLVDYYHYKNGSQACNIAGRLKVGASYFNSATHNPPNGAANRAQITDTWATNPAGGDWTPAQINGTAGSNNLVAFGWNSTDASPTIGLSSIRVRVSYTLSVALAQGSFALTGQSATLGVTIPAEQGSIVLAGQNATLTFTGGATLTAAAGVFALTGQNLTLDVTMPAAQSSIVLAGQGLSLGVAMPAAQGSVTLAGQSVTLQYSGSGAVLTAGVGMFAISGVVAGLVVAHRVTLAQGGITLAGQGLALGVTVLTVQGSVMLTGQSLTLRVVMSVVQGSIVLAGQSAALQFSGGGSYFLACGMHRCTLHSVYMGDSDCRDARRGFVEILHLPPSAPASNPFIIHWS